MGRRCARCFSFWQPAFICASFLFLLCVFGCAGEDDIRDLESLTTRFLQALESPDFRGWDAIFLDIGESEPQIPSISGIRKNMRNAGSRIERIEFLLTGGARVTASLQGDGLTSLITLRAEKKHGAWRFDKEIQVKLKFSGPISDCTPGAESPEA